MADPVPNPEPVPPPLSGWQWILWQTIRLVGPAVVSAIISGLAVQGVLSKADRAEVAAKAAHQAATERPHVVYLPAPKP